MFTIKGQRLVLLLCSVFLILISGCSETGHGQKIRVEKRMGNENKYDLFNEISDTEKVSRIKDILEAAEWRKAEVLRSHPPDYQFIFEFLDPNIEVKAVLYRVWISPNKDILEVGIGDGEYTQLNEEDSAVFFEILTGEVLAGE